MQKTELPASASSHLHVRSKAAMDCAEAAALDPVARQTISVRVHTLLVAMARRQRWCKMLLMTWSQQRQLPRLLLDQQKLSHTRSLLRH